MSSVLASVTVLAGTGFIMGQNIWRTIDDQLHAHSDEIAEIIRFMVEDKTPVLTGALKSDIIADSYPDTGDNDLAWITSANAEQVIVWNRIYVEYQEGGALGLPTYTNDPRLMFMDTAENDGPVACEVWAEKTIQYALDMCVMGVGLP